MVFTLNTPLSNERKQSIMRIHCEQFLDQSQTTMIIEKARLPSLFHKKVALFSMFQINGINPYAATTLGYLIYSLAQVFHFCIFGNRLIEEVTIISQHSSQFRHKTKFAEFFGDGGSLQLSLVRRIRRSENIRSNRMPAMPKSPFDFRSQVFHHFLGSLCFGTVFLQIFEEFFSKM